MNTSMTIDKLVLIKRVAGFANLGIIPSQRMVAAADGYIGDLTDQAKTTGDSLSFDGLKKAVGALRQSIMPSQELCQQGMAEIDRYLRPLRQARRERLAGAADKVVDRPRAG